MSLRVIFKSDQIVKWITDRNGTPVRTGDEYRIAFGPTSEPTLTIDELLEAMKLNHCVMLVERESGSTFHKIYSHR
jgi:hypothetical protein